MKKISSRKLSLSKETVRTLQPRDLKQAAGGYYPTSSTIFLTSKGGPSCDNICWSAEPDLCK